MGTSQSDLDHLFQLPLSEFTAARNALAAKLKKAGRAEESERVKRLLKPPASAWTVNQLYWRHGKELSALMDNGDRFRAAQAAQLAGKPADVRPLLALWNDRVRIVPRSGRPIREDRRGLCAAAERDGRPRSARRDVA